MLDFLTTLDRRWIFLMMALAVAIPVLTQATFPEAPTPPTRAVFKAVEDLPAGSLVLLAFDYDPGSAPELQPMATAFTRHCCLKKHKMIFLTLWPTGTPMVDQTIRDVIDGEFADLSLKYGEDYVNLGYRPGNEVTIKGVATEIRKLYNTDANGTSLDDLPLTKPVRNLFDTKLLLNVSAGYPGAKEWVQYGGTLGEIKIGVGVTGVQAPQMYPYYPDQVLGMLAALKGAAEYEAALGDRYEQYRDPKRNAAILRMGPQLFAHLLMVGLIVLGNVVHFANRRRGVA
ncbi:MAG: hypothetical protein SH850_27835 [Planctomycetaceae bacterium]|nr:hypothetical protein [Planctomycetaceae bacterium]